MYVNEVDARGDRKNFVYGIADKNCSNSHQEMKISVTNSTVVKILNTIQYIIHFVCQIDILALNDIEFKS